MSEVLKVEVIKIAAMSHINLQDGSFDILVQRLKSVLSYAERVKEIAADSNEPVSKRINIFRHDIVIPCDAQRIMQEAPEREGNYFVVPKILDGAR